MHCPAYQSFTSMAHILFFIALNSPPLIREGMRGMPAQGSSSVMPRCTVTLHLASWPLPTRPTNNLFPLSRASFHNERRVSSVYIVNICCGRAWRIPLAIYTRLPKMLYLFIWCFIEKWNSTVRDANSKGNFRMGTLDYIMTCCNDSKNNNVRFLLMVFGVMVWWKHHAVYSWHKLYLKEQGYPTELSGRPH